MKKMKYLSFYNIFLDIMQFFITSCGMTLLILFFWGDGEEITEQLIQNIVLSIFALLIIIVVPYRLLINNKWFYKDKIFSKYCRNDGSTAQLIKNIPENDNEKLILEITSIHEAGHAVVTLELGLNLISIKAGIDQGYISTSEKSNVLMTTEDLKSYAIMSYGGAAAEKVILGEIRAGSVGSPESDFSKAENIIKQMLLISDKYKGYIEFDVDFMEQVQKFSSELFNKAEKIILENKEIVQQIAIELQNKGKLRCDEVKQIIGGQRNENNYIFK